MERDTQGDLFPWMADPELGKAFIDFLHDVVPECRKEIGAMVYEDTFHNDVSSRPAAAQLFALFHPEAAALVGNEKDEEARLREKRTVRIINPPEHPIKNAFREILFTANVLLTLPTPSMRQAGLSLSTDLLERLKPLYDVIQACWYDHPIPIGIKPENNEVLYGLKHLDEAVAFEKKHGRCSRDIRVPVVLSVSVTHPGLDELAHDYLEAELRAAGGLAHLSIYIMGEKDARALTERFLLPLAQRLEPELKNAEALLSVFGVDGEYGRHYSFLKAVAALWQLLADPSIRAVFKIDLDQVFDQSALIRETGCTAFQLLAAPMWGAQAQDANGKIVDLGMLAGALVNEKDSRRGLFVPDVDYPSGTSRLEDLLFCSRYPQALSTKAEMMCRYGEEGSPDGRTTCLQRIHVTGGTTGVLIESLYRWQTFTPSFIGRAEDQAYILSSFDGSEQCLGYLHQPGLIMRHDKESFAAEAIAAADMGKQIGDYVRMILFSAYADCLPGGKSAVKERLDPFAGSFVSRMPVTLAVFRLLLKVESLYLEGQRGAVGSFFRDGMDRLKKAVAFTRLDTEGRSALRLQLEEERRGWSLFYRCLRGFAAPAEIDGPTRKRLALTGSEMLQKCRLS